MSRRMHVLVLEDDPFVSMDIEMIVAEILPADVQVSSSIEEAQRVLSDGVDLALLDIDVIGGKSFPIAEQLANRNTPFIFVSGSQPEELPPALRGAPFVAKPYEPDIVEAVIRDALGIDA